MRPISIITTAAAVCGVSSGCATQGPQPTEELTRARTLIEQAEKAQKAEAQRYAAPDLQRARDELSSAEVARSRRAASGGAPEAKYEHFGSTTVFGRPGQPAELASIYVQLAAADASFDYGNYLRGGRRQGQP
jgi:hypothetical protein